MSEKTWERNTTGLVAHAKLRKEQKRKRVDDAITRLLRDHEENRKLKRQLNAALGKAYDRL
jgi:hypothetical protein